MASSRAYLDYVLEQLSGLEGISYRAMMGEYILYVQGKIFGGIYDDRLLVKPVKAALKCMPDAPCEQPYEGAKAMLLVEDVDNRDFLQELVNAMVEELPVPKKRKKRFDNEGNKPVIVFEEVKMMITQAFHDENESLFSPGAFLGERKYLCDTAIATFSCEIRDAVLERFPHEAVAHTASANGHKPVYLLDVNGRKYIFYMSSIGAALAGNDVIEVQWQTGIQKLIMFGSAGSLNRQATTGKYVIPTQAYRDEGMSYHYALPSDYISVSNSGFLTAVFEKLHLPYVNGRVWTTDAPYRETRTAIRKRKNEGCIAVEMELAGVQAVCSFCGIELYDFLVTGDIFDADVYDPQGLHEANHSFDKFYVALKIAEEL